VHQKRRRRGGGGEGCLRCLQVFALTNQIHRESLARISKCPCQVRHPPFHCRVITFNHQHTIIHLRPLIQNTRTKRESRPALSSNPPRLPQPSDTPQRTLPKMSLVNLSHVCSHLQNASLARLGLTSVPLSKFHLSLSLHLQKQGFLSSVNLGGPSPPAKLLPPSSAPSTSQRQQSSDDSEIVTQENRASRRLWLGMKYWDGEPVLRKMKMLSKPTKRIWVNADELGQIVRGRDAHLIRGMRAVGECIFVSTDKGIMEARECVERKIGGMVLCRVF